MAAAPGATSTVAGAGQVTAGVPVMTSVVSAGRLLPVCAFTATGFSALTPSGRYARSAGSADAGPALRSPAAITAQRSCMPRRLPLTASP
ncbi:hypothetical protein Pa4123_20090 [Phytohabitans aurantiacus]|uniref:Uncharacterized protein n=1 Tax=Phytohabitans aurantiacus TaxID=3016789 RepID=A0ABQ5QTT6_9ACTN|nr:hypothetical protein Pa4123_20090 [Phytohabitans aurantiacus]